MIWQLIWRMLKALFVPSRESTLRIRNTTASMLDVGDFLLGADLKNGGWISFISPGVYVEEMWVDHNGDISAYFMDFSGKARSIAMEPNAKIRVCEYVNENSSQSVYDFGMYAGELMEDAVAKELKETK